MEKLLQIDFTQGGDSMTVEMAHRIHSELGIATRVSDGKRLTFQYEGLRHQQDPAQ